MRRLITAAALAAVCVGCTSYTARQIQIRSPEDYRARATVGQVTLAADKLDTHAKWDAVFDTAPAYERGYDAINVVVFNDSPDAVTVDPQYAVCQTAQADISPADPVAVAESVLRNTAGRFVAGGILSAGSSSSANEQIRSDFVNKALPGRVRAGGASTGFVYCPNAAPVVGLNLRVTDTRGDTDVSLDLR